MRRPPRIAVLIALLAGAAAWVAIDLRGPAAPTSAKAPTSGASQDPERAAAPASEAKQPGIPARSALGRIAADPFSAQSWLPRRKPAVVSSAPPEPVTDRKSTRLNSSHPSISYAVFCLKKKIKNNPSKSGKKKKKINKTT